MKHIEKIIRQLRQQKKRMTRTRKEIIAFFLAQTTPTTAKDVLYHFLTKKNPINKTTVYREIEFLIHQKILTKLHIFDNERAYEITSSIHHHHLTCDRCGTIQEINVCDTNYMERAINKNKDFIITRHVFEFFGVCAKCKHEYMKGTS